MRKRRHIPTKQKLAAALACLLPQETRDQLRHHEQGADTVIALFEWDHAVLHALGGSDEWQNLTPMLKGAHREKSRTDTSKVAKVRRIDDKWRAFTRAMAAGRKPRRKTRGRK